MKNIFKKMVMIFLVAGALAAVFFMMNPERSERFLVRLFNPLVQYFARFTPKTYPEKFARYKPVQQEVWGIDISHHQIGIDWDAFQKSKPHFAFVKATEGISHVDTRYHSYVDHFRELNIPVGSYHFFTYRFDGLEQARHFLKYAHIRKGDMLPVLDAEVSKRMASRDWVTRNLKRFLEHVESETGLRPIIYCTHKYYRNYLEGELDGDYPLWICDYYKEPSCKYNFWQRTDKFRHEAFAGTVDLNYFKGTVDELKKFTVNQIN